MRWAARWLWRRPPSTSPPGLTLLPRRSMLAADRPSESTQGDSRDRACQLELAIRKEGVVWQAGLVGAVVSQGRAKKAAAAADGWVRPDA